MKITLDIPNEHAPALLAMVSDLMPVRLEPQADPAEGHPELPLDDESEAIAETRWAPVQGIDAADPLKVEMEPAAPVRYGDAELPFPEGFPELPPLPEGYSRWVYRGRFDKIACGRGTPCQDRQVKYLGAGIWHETVTFDGPMHHIEAL